MIKCTSNIYIAYIRFKYIARWSLFTIENDSHLYSWTTRALPGQVINWTSAIEEIMSHWIRSLSPLCSVSTCNNIAYPWGIPFNMPQTYAMFDSVANQWYLNLNPKRLRRQWWGSQGRMVSKYIKAVPQVQVDVICVVIDPIYMGRRSAEDDFHA